MFLFVAIGALLLILIVLWDTFETIVLPRGISRRIRLASIFHRITWVPWSSIARRIENPSMRETYLSFYGPLSILLLLSVWAYALIFGFAALLWALGAALTGTRDGTSFGTDLYLSGTTFFTLGLGDVTPRTTAARIVTLAEAGLGFAFLGLVVGYLPVIYQAFSRHEVIISLLDARAGSPPTVCTLFLRHSQFSATEAHQLLRDWERWSAELMESHLSHPVLAYFRSHHEDQSWLAALTLMLDASALLIAGMDGIIAHQAHLTFAIARGAAMDLCQVFDASPQVPVHDRLQPSDFRRCMTPLRRWGYRWLRTIVLSSGWPTSVAGTSHSSAPSANSCSFLSPPGSALTALRVNLTGQSRNHAFPQGIQVSARRNR